MPLTASKRSLKRPRPNIVNNDVWSTKFLFKIGYSIDRTALKNFIFRYVNFQQSNYEGRASCVFQHNPRTAHLLNDNYKRSNGRLFRKELLFFQVILVTFPIIFSSRPSNYRFVTGELQHSQLYREENRSNSNRSWKDGEKHGIHTLLKYSQGGDVSFPYAEEEEQGTSRSEKGRELVGEALERFIQQQKVTNSVQEKLPPALRSDFGADSSNLSQSPYETNVSSRPLITQPPLNEPITLMDYGESIKKGNPLIQSVLPINFEFDVLVRDAMTNELLKGLENILESHIQTEYQKLVDRGSIENKNTDGISKSPPKSLKLGEVDLTLSLVESRWWQERHWRQLRYSSSSLKRSLRSRRRKIQEGGQVSNTKLITISVDGTVFYSMTLAPQTLLH